MSLNSERKFFITAQILMLLGVIVIYKIFGFYYDEYEGIFSTFVSGVYTDRILDDYDIDMHFLILPIYAKLSSFFPQIDIYGIVLLLLSIFAIILFLKIVINNTKAFGIKIRYLLIVLISIVVVPLILIEISSTKAVFFSFFSFCILIFQNALIFKNHKFACLLFIFFLSLLRIDAVVLSSFIFICSTVILRKFRWFYLSFLITGVLVFLSHKMVLKFSSEAKNVFYYKELSFFDKNALRTDITDPILKEEVRILKDNFIFDDIHFSYQFYNDVLLNNNPLQNKEYFSIAFTQFLHVVNTSLKEFLQIKFLLVLVFLSFLIFVFTFKKRYKEKFFFLFVTLFPIIVGNFVVIPVRFICPYYLILLFIFLYHFITKSILLAYVMLFFTISATYLYSFDVSNLKIKDHHRYENVMREFNKISYEKNMPIVFDNMLGLDLFPSKLFYKIPEKQNIFILNFYLFNSYNSYLSHWKSFCYCNPLSLTEKMNFVSSNQIPFIIRKDKMDEYRKYFKIKYAKSIDFKTIQKIGDTELVYTYVVFN